MASGSSHGHNNWDWIRGATISSPCARFVRVNFPSTGGWMTLPSLFHTYNDRWKLNYIAVTHQPIALPARLRFSRIHRLFFSAQSRDCMFLQTWYIDCIFSKKKKKLVSYVQKNIRHVRNTIINKYGKSSAPVYLVII